MFSLLVVKGLLIALLVVAAAVAEGTGPPPSPPPNITQIMDSAGQFATFLSLLTATKVDQLFQARANTTTTGITIFAPTDRAFWSVDAGVISKLPAQQKIRLLQFHALSAFYPLSALQQATDPLTPTLATDTAGAGKFTVNVTNHDGTVVISTGLSNAALVSTLYNTLPCGVFAINEVLLPVDIFGLPESPAPAPAPAIAAGAPSPAPSTIVISSSPASPFESNPGFVNPNITPPSSALSSSSTAAPHGLMQSSPAAVSRCLPWPAGFVLGLVSLYFVHFYSKAAFFIF